MKTSSKYFTALTTAIVATTSAANAANLFFEDFEDNSLITAPEITTTKPFFHDGGNDYFHITPLNGAAESETGAYAGFGGSNYFAAEDIDDGAGAAQGSAIITITLGIGGWENLSVSTLFAAGGNDGLPAYDPEDGFRMRASIDGGTAQNLLAFESVDSFNTNSQLRQDANFDGTGDAAGFLPDHNFTAFNGMAISGTGNTLVLEIEITSDDGNGQILFDNLSIDGDFTIPEPSSGLLALLGSALLFGRRRN